MSTLRSYDILSALAPLGQGASASNLKQQAVVSRPLGGAARTRKEACCVGDLLSSSTCLIAGLPETRMVTPPLIMNLPGLAPLGTVYPSRC
jgi:hypothetical protein